MTFSGSSSYVHSYLRGNGSSVSGDATTSTTSSLIFGCMTGGGTTANVFASSIIDIPEYASTSKNKTIKYFSGFHDPSPVSEINIGSGLSMSTTAVTSITLTIGSSAARTLASGSIIALYGIK
jgi:hypothetical protein